MWEAILTLTPISLLDSLSVVPMCLVPMGMMLISKKPMQTTLAFLFGLFITYFPFGLAVYFGLNSVFAVIGAFFTQVWLQPTYLDIVLGILIGALLVFFGYWLVCDRAKKGHLKDDDDKPADNEGWNAFTPFTAFLLAVGFNISGMWGAFPLFAAIDMMLKQNISNVEAVLYLFYYNIVFIAPLLAFVLVHRMMGEKAEVIFSAITAFILHWGKKILATVLIILGLAMIIDGSSILLGSPVFPQPEGFVFPS